MSISLSLLLLFNYLIPPLLGATSSLQNRRTDLLPNRLNTIMKSEKTNKSNLLPEPFSEGRPENQKKTIEKSTTTNKSHLPAPFSEGQPEVAKVCAENGITKTIQIDQSPSMRGARKGNELPATTWQQGAL